jgi:putative Mg2+ transporter-C (MgtC) family protein
LIDRLVAQVLGATTAPGDLALLGRIALGFGVAYLLGIERELRGSPAGGRTFAAVGAGAAAITAVAYRTSPQAVAGVVTGIGFIGGGVVFHRDGGMVRGVTTAATIFAVAALGVVVGYGHLWLGAVTAAMLMLMLELPHLPWLRGLDVQRLSRRFENDPALGGGQSDSDGMPPPTPDAGTPGERA